MTVEEKEAIKGRALLRLYKAKEDEAVHRKQLDEMANKVQSVGHALQVHSLKMEGGRFCRDHLILDYPPFESISKALSGHQEALYEKEQAAQECRDLGLSV